MTLMAQKRILIAQLIAWLFPPVGQRPLYIFKYFNIYKIGWLKFLCRGVQSTFPLRPTRRFKRFLGFFCFVLFFPSAIRCIAMKKIGRKKKKNTHWHHRDRSIAAVISVSPPAVAPYALQLTISCNQPTAPTWICDCQLGYYGNHIWMFL